VFQGAASTLLITPAIKIFAYCDPKDTIGVLEIIGMIIWVVGIVFEIVGDI